MRQDGNDSRRLQSFARKPVVKVVVDGYPDDPEALRVTVDSLKSQLYQEWRLVVCMPGHTVSARADDWEIGHDDRRIEVVRTESHLNALDLGLLGGAADYICVLSLGDQLVPRTLMEAVAALQDGEIDVIYSDHDVRGLDGELHSAYCKPDWSPDLLLSSPYVLPFTMYAADLIALVGRCETDGPEDYAFELALRCTERARAVAHIPQILCHQAPRRPDDGVTRQTVLRGALSRRGIAGTVQRTGNSWRVERALQDPRKVTIIIPTRDNLPWLRRCIESIERRTSYRRYDIVIVDNGSRDSETLSYLARTPHCVIRDDGPFNYSRLNNRAASESDGQYLLLMNDDTEVVSDGWMEALVEQAQRPDVGAVGAKLLYPDGRLQHAGLILGVGGIANPIQQGLPGDSGGYHNFANLVREYSAVTGACMMLRREVFERMGGLDEVNLPVAFNDVDLCLRLRQAGYRVLFTPYAVLVHAESATREGGVGLEEDAYMRRRWGEQIMRDPYYSPTLTRVALSCEIDMAKPDGTIRDMEQPRFETVTRRLKRGVPVEQRVVAPADRLVGVSVRFATYERRLSAHLRLRVLADDQSRRELVSAETRGLVIDNAEHYFGFSPVDGVEGKWVRLSVERLSQHWGRRMSLWRSAHAVDMLGDSSDGPGTLTFSLFVRAKPGVTRQDCSLS